VGKFDKNSKCGYCGEEMIPVNRNKKFCSDKCRVYYRRENVKFIAAKTGQDSPQKSVESVTSSQKEPTKAELLKLIMAGKM